MSPANLVAALLCIWLILSMLEWYNAAKITLRCAVFVFLSLGFLPLGQNGLHYLETQYQRPAKWPHIDGILVLGGAVDIDNSSASGRPEFNDGVDRVLMAVELARYFPKARLVFSGGSPNIIHNQPPDSIEINRFLKNMGYEDFNVIYEEKSRNTYENIKNSYSLLSPKEGENWVLVTSAFHMPRAMAVAQKIGWGLIPYPVDYRGGAGYVFLPFESNTLDNLRASQISLREMIGMAAYKLTGKL